MKRCPQCEFLYEDDQSLCDMDGILLVYDGRQLPHLQAISTTTTHLPVKNSRKTVPALATVVLASVLGLVYYVSTQRHTNQPSYAPPAMTTSTVGTNAIEAPATTPEAKVEENSSEAGGVKAEEADKGGTENPKDKAVRPASESDKKPAGKPKAVPVRSSVQPSEKDSKVGSFFKKTGRILKKPFKF